MNLWRRLMVWRVGRVLGLLLAVLSLACTGNGVEPGEDSKLSANPTEGLEPTEESQPLADLIAQVAALEIGPYLAMAAQTDGGYGFQVGDDPRTATLAHPVAVFAFDYEKVKTATDDASLCDMLEPVDEWLVPVQIDGEYRTVFGVSLMGEEWGGAFLGNPYLASQLSDLRDTWSGDEGDAFRLISSTAPRGFLFTVCDAVEEEGDVPPPSLTTLTRLIFSDRSELLPPDDLNSLQSPDLLLGRIRQEIEQEELEGSAGHPTLDAFR